MTSLELSKKLKMQHFSIIRLIQTYRKELLQIGKLEEKLIEYGEGTPGGRPYVCFILTENQANLIVCFLKNSKENKQLKTNIIKKLDKLEKEKEGYHG